MSDWLQKLIPTIVGALFAAGIFYGSILAMKRDLNGIGRKQRAKDEIDDRVYLAFFIIALSTEVPKENQESYFRKATMLLDSRKKPT